MHITRVTECDVISCRMNDGLGLLMRPDCNVQAKDNKYNTGPGQERTL